MGISKNLILGLKSRLNQCINNPTLKRGVNEILSCKGFSHDLVELVILTEEEEN